MKRVELLTADAEMVASEKLFFAKFFEQYSSLYHEVYCEVEFEYLESGGDIAFTDEIIHELNAETFARMQNLL